VNDRSAPGIIRATAFSLLTPEPTGTTTAAMEAAVRDAEPLVRRAAAERLAVVDVQTRLQLGPRLLADSVRTVRIESVPAMASVPPALVSGDLRKTLDAALAEYRAVQQFGADRADASVNLGVLEADLGNAQAAEAAYRRAIRLQPQYAPAYVNLADLLRATTHEEDAERVLREGLQRIPGLAQLHYALGLSLVRQKRSADAIAEFRQAATLAPDDPRYPYVYAVALHDAGNVADAMRTLSEAQRRHSADRDILQALVTYALELRDGPAALKWAHLLEQAAPDDTALAAQVRDLERRLAKP
jgi:tetratricopeptide (TPR) repeat protein